jgi:hypothetical protein
MLNPLFDPDSYHAVRKPLLAAASEFAVHVLSNWVLDS